jgi:hypothetical protein
VRKDSLSLHTAESAARSARLEEQAELGAGFDAVTPSAAELTAAEHDEEEVDAVLLLQVERRSEPGRNIRANRSRSRLLLLPPPPP